MIPRFIHSGMAGAPAMSTAVSGLLSVFNAALVDGFNVTAPQTVVASGGVVTFTYLMAHGYENGCWVRVSGAAQAALNADRRCTVPGALSFTVAVPGIPDGPVSGSISVRVAPLGWDRPFTDTNIAVYRSPDISGSRMFLQVRDNNQNGQIAARLRGFESMTSATVGVDPFPTVAQIADAAGSALAITKTASGIGAGWAMAGDDRTFYFAHAQDVSTFGDINSLRPADAYGCWVFGGNNNNTALANCTGSNSEINGVLCRDGTGLVKSLVGGHLGMSPGASGQTRPYPGANSGGVSLVAPMILMDGVTPASSPVRGTLRGLLYVMEAIPVDNHMVIDAVPGITGRVLIMRDRGSSASLGSVAVPIDQEW